jgi:hypothetical protein
MEHDTSLSAQLATRDARIAEEHQRAADIKTVRIVLQTFYDGSKNQLPARLGINAFDRLFPRGTEGND